MENNQELELQITTGLSFPLSNRFFSPQLSLTCDVIYKLSLYFDRSFCFCPAGKFLLDVA